MSDVMKKLVTVIVYALVYVLFHLSMRIYYVTCYSYRRIFVYIFCVISICALAFTRATESLVLNIERTSQN